MRVSELMTKVVACVRCNDPCGVAAKLMWDCDCGAVPVVDEGERVVGMITDRDICMAAWSRDSAPSAIRTGDVMSRQLYFCSPGDGVGLAENLMRSHQIRRIPVLDGERRLAGILSLADIARAGGRADPRSTGSEVAPMQVASTLANICQPAPVRIVNAAS
ncbi:MAG TPA: CBS domain-containing protein [Polyangiaceae bacterium]